MWLQKQRRDSQCNGIGLCRILSTGKTSVHLPRNQQGRKFGGITTEIFSISCVAIAVENLTRHRRRKNWDASTYQSNNFGVSRKRFKPATPGSNAAWSSDVVLKTKVLVSRRLEDKNTSLGLGLGLETQSLGLDLGLDKKVLSIFKPFLSLLMTENYDIVV